MGENEYILDILSGLGFAINEKNNSEIIINYPIKFNKKSMEFSLSSDYKITLQPVATFLADFLNCNFDDYDDFLNFFCKYSLSLLDYKKLVRTFKNNTCSSKEFEQFVLNLLSKNKNYYRKLQEQTDMILDYCLINPSKRALEFKPIERLHVLRRVSPSLTLLHEHKAAYYSVTLFSSYPGETEKQIYEFLSKKKNEVTEQALILPYDISAILYKSICSILKEDVYLKVCKNCSKFFIATNKSLNYCSNIAPNDNKKTCRQIGRRISFENNKNSDPVLFLYYQVYSRKSMMKSRNPDIEQYANSFNKFKEIGKKKLGKYKNGEISPEEFKKWIQKNS